MDDKRRFNIIIASVTFGTVISLFLFALRRGGFSNITANDTSSIVSYFAFSLVFVLIFGFFMKKKKDKNEPK